MVQISHSVVLATLSLRTAAGALNKCGIAVSWQDTSGDCSTNIQMLEKWNPKAASEINCFGYGGAEDPCSLNVNNDPNIGMDKDPSKCTDGVLYLWDEPYTQCNDNGKCTCPVCQNCPTGDADALYTCTADAFVQKWKEYAKKWSAELKGMQVTTPLFANYAGPDVTQQINDFFEKCGSECNNKDSEQFIDIIAMNEFIGVWNKKGDGPIGKEEMQGAVKFINGQAQEVKKKNPTSSGDPRPVALTNFCFLGNEADGGTPAVQIEVIQDSGIFDADSIDSVFWFAAKDYAPEAHRLPEGNNHLDAEAGGSTIGEEFLKKCFEGAPAPAPSPDEEDEEDDDSDSSSTPAPEDPTTTDPAEPTPVPEDPTTPDPAETTPSPEDPTTPEPTTAPEDPTTAPEDPTSPEPTIAPEDPTTPEPTTVEPEETTSKAPEETTTYPVGPTPSPERCHTCMTMCAPCRECIEGPGGSFSFGSCEKCWQCWDYDDDELEDDDDDMDEECDALDKEHDWDDEEVRCLTDENQDCRACWAAELGDVPVLI